MVSKLFADVVSSLTCSSSGLEMMRADPVASKQKFTDKVL